MIQHCVAFFRRNQKEKAYRIYVTDALKAIAENTAKQGGGLTMSVRYADMINLNDKQQPEETRTAEEVITSIKDKISRMGG